MMFYKETEFQDTSIGKIPKDWEVGDASLINVLKGYAFSSEFFNGKKDGTPLIRIRDLAKKETESHYSGTYDPAYLVKKGDILISMDGEFDVYLWDGPEGLLNQRVCKVWSKETAKLNTIFLFYELQKPLKILESQISQTTVKHLLDRDLERIKIPVPSLEEQRAIVGVLGVVDSAIELVNKVIAKTERLKKGLMQTLLTRGIGHTEYKDTPMGKIPKEWDVVRLKDIAIIERGKFAHRPRNEPRFYGGKIPFIQTGDVAEAKGLIKNYSQTLNEEGLKISKLFKKGTIVVSIAGNIGDVGVLDFDSCFPDSVIGISVRGNIDVFFLMYMLQNLQYELSARAPRSTQKNINLEILGSLTVLIPLFSEQQKIAAVLSDVNMKLELERKEKAKLEKIKRGLMDLLLTGKVRVKVD